MSNYIEYKALPQKKERSSFLDDDFNAGWNACLNNIKSIFAADLVPVRHGKWINPHWQDSTHCMNCNQCGYEAQHRVYCGVEKYYRYCPNCGALMDKDGDGEAEAALKGANNGT